MNIPEVIKFPPPFDVYSGVLLHGKSGRRFNILGKFSLDGEEVTSTSDHEYEEIKPMLFRITKGDRSWLVGTAGISNPIHKVHKKTEWECIVDPSILVVTEEGGVLLGTRRDKEMTYTHGDFMVKVKGGLGWFTIKKDRKTGVKPVQVDLDTCNDLHDAFRKAARMMEMPLYFDYRIYR